jgi:hypothetical protein
VWQSRAFPNPPILASPFGVHRQGVPKVSRFRVGCAAIQGEAVFQIIAIPFDAYAALPSPQHRWLLTCLARYSDRDGRCWPSMRQLATDARMSLASVCRYLKLMAELGVFQRVRRGVGRYVYTLSETYRTCWPGSWKGRVPAPQRGVSGAGTQEAKPAKQNRFAEILPEEPWQQRIDSWRKSRFWLPQWGPKPNDPGCFASPALLRATMANDRRSID